MRTCPTSDDTFIPKNREHVFSDVACFDAYIEEIDPLDRFEITKRDIDWGPFERECRECGKEFVTTHPATFYCETHRGPQRHEKEEEPVAKKTATAPAKGSRIFQPKIKDCDSCERPFFATSPAMKFCEECSPKGGELIQQ